MLLRDANHLNRTRAPGAFEYRIAPSAAAIRLARHALAQWLELQQAVDRDGVDDLLVACSELFTNAVEHSRDDESSMVAVRGRADGTSVVLEIENDGDFFARPIGRKMMDVLDDDSLSERFRAGGAS